MAKSAQVSRSFDKSIDEVKDALKYALHRMNLKGTLVPGDEMIVQLKVPLNVLSWGETVNIRVKASGEVEIQSTCSYRYQIVDWGKNRRNIEKIFTCMDEYFQGYRAFI